MGRSLLIGVTPHPGESLSSLISRTAQANGLPGPGFVLRAAGIASALPRMQSEISALAKVCRVSTDLIRVLSPLEWGVCHQGSGHRRRYQYYGTNVGMDHLLVGTSERVCPVCIRTSGHLPGVHAFTFVTACPYHAVRLLDHCPACDRTIDMMRPRLDLCHCGFGLGAQNEVPVSDDEMRVVRLVCRRWQLNFLRDTPPRCLDVFDDFNDLDLDDLLRAISFFCKLEGANQRGWHEVSRSKRVRAIAWRIERVGRLMRDWPHRFKTQIGMVRSPLVGGSPRASSGAIGRVSLEMFTELPEPKFAFIHRVLVSNMQERNARAQFGMAEA
jgi:hypothetical protein